jgi:prolyl 4-hydroxylase
MWSPPVLVATAPRIFVIDGFASAAEADAIFRDAAPHLEPSQTQSADGSMQRAAFGRQSQQYTLSPRLWSPTAASVVHRMDAATLQPHGHGEHLTVTEYNVGDHYEAHVDSSLAAGRAVTALLFLEAPDQGGELIFPWAASPPPSSNAHVHRPTPVRPPGVNGTGRSLSDYFSLDTLPRLGDANMCGSPSEALRIEPRVGRLVVFFNHDPEGRQLRPRSLHGSCPVRAGRKRIAQRWYRWHDLSSPNELGTTLERLHGEKGWRVDYRAQMRREREETEVAELQAENARLRTARGVPTQGGAGGAFSNREEGSATGKHEL